MVWLFCEEDSSTLTLEFFWAGGWWVDLSRRNNLLRFCIDQFRSALIGHPINPHGSLGLGPHTVYSGAVTVISFNRMRNSTQDFKLGPPSGSYFFPDSFIIISAVLCKAGTCATISFESWIGGTRIDSYPCFSTHSLFLFFNLLMKWPMWEESYMCHPFLRCQLILGRVDACTQVAVFVVRKFSRRARKGKAFFS